MTDLITALERTHDRPRYVRDILKDLYKGIKTPILFIACLGFFYWNLIVLTDQIIAGNL